MKILHSKIDIYENGADEEPFTLNFVHEIQIESSWRNFTDTAIISLPRFMQKDLGETKLRDKLKKWSKDRPEIEVYLGYDLDKEDTPVNLAFKGIIRDVKGRTPIELICEDHMYKLKTGLINNIYDGKTVQDLLADKVFSAKIKEGTIQLSDDIIDLNLGHFEVKEQTPMQVLERLRDEYGLHSFIRCEKKGITYMPYLHITATPHPKEKPPSKKEPRPVFQFYNNIIADQLEYKSLEDVSVAVKYKITGKTVTDKKDISGKLLKENGEEVVIKEGITQTISYTINTSEVDLSGGEDSDDGFSEEGFSTQYQSLADTKLKQLVYEGFRGSLTTFGDVLYTGDTDVKTFGGFVRHGGVVELREKEEKTEEEETHRNTDYYVDAVNYTFGQGGFRQEIILGKAVNEIKKEIKEN